MKSLWHPGYPWLEYKYIFLGGGGGQYNRPLPTSPGPQYQNEVQCSAFNMEMIFHSHANKSYFPKKGSALGLILKARVFGTRRWPILLL